ncbi:MAG: L-threonylcarbamoyladenylate synthase [Patescibacteria group bacterium]
MLKKIIEYLKNGGVIVYPTETAYALGCDATNQRAVDLVFKLKKRAKSKTLPLIVGSLAMVKKYCQMSAAEERLAKKYWPGALTMILNVLSSHSHEACPRAASGNGNSAFLAKGIVAKDGTVAIRVSSNKMARELSRGLGAPLVSTSANLAGEGECYSVNNAKKSFSDSVIFLDGGRLKKQKPSTIVKIENGKIKILRQGEIKLC